ncbi:MAG: hypothetical protein ACE5R6_01700 [Candidatus Heimdallarchaeota archaeon]
MEPNISEVCLEKIEEIFAPKDKLRIYSNGMVFEAIPLAPFTKDKYPVDLKSNPSFFIAFNYIFQLKPLMSSESLSHKLLGEIRSSLRDFELEYNKQDLLVNLFSSLTLTQLTNLALAGVGIAILNDDEYCWAIKGIDSFILEIRGEGGGKWKFPPCILGIPILSPSKAELTVYVLQPENYVHPFLIEAGAICLGSFSDSRSLEAIAFLKDITSKIIHLFSYAEQILVSGYRMEEGVEPAIDIFDPIFRKYRLRNRTKISK